MLAPVLAVLILIGYGLAVWWLLRRESRSTVLVLTILAALSLCLRLVYTHDYPAGVYEDEPNYLDWAMQALSVRHLFGESRVLIPGLLGVLFEAQLVPLLGPGRWAMRLYSMLTSVLATPGAFAVARSFGMAVVPSLGAGSLIAVLPWALLYGRIHLGGELIFHQMLLLAVLARLVRSEDRWPDVVIGCFALTLLLYDYWAGRTMLGMPIVAAVLARGRRRAWCLAIIVVALIAYIPYLSQAPPNAVQGVTSHIRPELYQHPLQDVWMRLQLTLKTFVSPTANDGWGTIRAGAMQPVILLALAALGLLLGPLRRSLFLLGGFCGGIAPAVLSDGAPSVHRMLLAFPFVVFAACRVFELLRPPRVRACLTAAIVALLALQSVRLYFSDTFWSTESRWLFDWERTELVEALPPPPHPRFFISRQIGFYFFPRGQVDANYDWIDPGNWNPPSGPSSYAFDWSSARLRPFYENLLGIDRVRPFGRAFLINFGGEDWAWMRQHGWAYSAGCDMPRKRWQAVVPTLYQHMNFNDMVCSTPVQHVWQARWNGPPAALRFVYTGEAVIADDHGALGSGSGFERSIRFTAEPDRIITVRLSAALDRPMVAELVEQTPVDERVPYWERVTPVPIAEPPQ